MEAEADTGRPLNREDMDDLFSLSSRVYAL